MTLEYTDQTEPIQRRDPDPYTVSRLFYAVFLVFFAALGLALIGFAYGTLGDFRAAYFQAEALGLAAMAATCAFDRHPKPRMWIYAFVAALAICAGIDAWLYFRGPIMQLTAEPLIATARR